MINSDFVGRLGAGQPPSHQRLAACSAFLLIFQDDLIERCVLSKLEKVVHLIPAVDHPRAEHTDQPERFVIMSRLHHIRRCPADHIPSAILLIFSLLAEHICQLVDSAQMQMVPRRLAFDCSLLIIGLVMLKSSYTAFAGARFFLFGQENFMISNEMATNVRNTSMTPSGAIQGPRFLGIHSSTSL